MDLDPKTKEPIIVTDLDMSQIQKVRQHHREQNLIHMAAFGGWNGPHPPATNGINGKEWCHAFVKFNQQYGDVFDGIDWDLEGHDERNSSTSQFTIEVLNIMADFSKEAKENFDLLVSLAPAESYFDPLLSMDKKNNTSTIEINSKDDSSDVYETDSFSMKLNLFPSVWNQNEQDRQYIRNAGFSHAGLQCYTYVLHRAGLDTFDWIGRYIKCL